MSKEHAIGAGIYNLLDNLLIAGGGWIFWVLVSKIMPIPDVGFAVTMISLVVLISGLLGFGLEFVLLKESGKSSKSFQTITLFEIISHVASIPILYLVLLHLYDNSLESLFPISAIFLVLTGIGFTIRHTLLGKLQSRLVLFVDLSVLSVRFGIIVLIFEMGSNAIMIAYTAQVFAASIVGYYLLKSRYKLEPPSFLNLKEQMRKSISNISTKYTRLFIGSFTVVFVAYFVANPTMTASFYIAIMFFAAIGGISYSILIMSLPASNRYKQDLFSNNLRVSFAIMLPIIAIIATVPILVLDLVNSEYRGAADSLRILSVAVIPTTLVTCAIMRFNYENKNRLLVKVGIAEIASLLVLMVILTPIFGILGASISILVSVSSAIPFIFRSIPLQDTKNFLYCICIAIASILAGSYSITFGSEIIGIIVSGSLCVILALILKILQKNDITLILNGLLRR